MAKIAEKDAKILFEGDVTNFLRRILEIRYYTLKLLGTVNKYINNMYLLIKLILRSLI